MNNLLQLQASLQALEGWVIANDFKGWDPFDALRSPVLSKLTFGNRQLGQLWVQLFKHSPINLRPLFGVRKGYNPKGMGLLLSTYARRFVALERAEDLEKAQFFANWLIENISTGYRGACWGYNFDWPNRGFFAPAGTPTIVNTGFIGLAFLDFAQALRKTNQSSDSATQTAISACEFILTDLNQATGDNELCFSYTPIDHRYIHNANMLGAWLLSEVYLQNHNSSYAENALKAANFTAHRIESSGAWKYGVNSIDNWADNFHTGYVLVGLKRVSKNLDINEFGEQISLGYEFWKNNFFLPDGTSKYYSNSAYPIDSHSAAQAILTFLEFTDVDPEALVWACRVAEWGCAKMQDPKGYFYYQKNRLYVNKIPYMRWSEAWMLHALTDLQIKLEERELL